MSAVPCLTLVLALVLGRNGGLLLGSGLETYGRTEAVSINLESLTSSRRCETSGALGVETGDGTLLYGTGMPPATSMSDTRKTLMIPFSFQRQHIVEPTAQKHIKPILQPDCRCQIQLLLT
jgi:hypothetical protein